MEEADLEEEVKEGADWVEVDLSEDTECCYESSKVFDSLDRIIDCQEEDVGQAVNTATKLICCQLNARTIAMLRHGYQKWIFEDPWQLHTTWWGRGWQGRGWRDRGWPEREWWIGRRRTWGRRT